MKADSDSILEDCPVCLRVKWRMSTCTHGKLKPVINRDEEVPEFKEKENSGGLKDRKNSKYKPN